MVDGLLASDVITWADRIERDARLPHEKRALRVRALQDLKDAGVWEDAYSDYMLGNGGEVRLKLKTKEWAKADKVGRVICDLGTPASLRSGHVYSFLKRAMAECPLLGDGYSISFVPTPDVPTLTQVFRRMTQETMAVVFSDDIAVSIQCDDGTLYAELDLSSADSSHSHYMWEALRECIPEELMQDYNMSVEQALRPCVAGYGRTALRFLPVHPVLYSGHTGTTTFNNLASFNLCDGLLAGLPRDVRSCRSTLEERIARAPWKATCEFRTQFEQLTFLKHSPVLGDDDQWHAVLNQGVILRALGQKDGDLPGRGSLKARAFDFNAGLVKGLCHAGNTSLMRLLRNKFPWTEETVPRYSSWLVEHSTGCSDVPVRDDSLVKRYNLSEDHWSELLECLRDASFGDVIDTHASRTIMRMDYGL